MGLNDLEWENFRHEAGHPGRKTTRHGRVQVHSPIGDAWLPWIIVLVGLPLGIGPGLERRAFLRIEGGSQLGDVCPNSSQVRRADSRLGLFCSRMRGGLSKDYGRRSEQRQDRNDRFHPSTSHMAALPS